MSIGPTTKRFSSLSILAAVGALLGLPFGRSICSLSNTVADYVSPLPQYAGWVPIILCGFAVATVTCFVRPRWLHFHHMLAYPPILLAVPFGAALPWLVGRVAGFPVFQAAEGESAWLSGLGLGYILLIMLVVRLRYGTSGRPAAPQVNPQTGGSPTLDSAAWLLNESPITSAKHDLLNYTHRAERIVKALDTERVPGSGLMQTVVVHGLFGSGKSSLINLVKERAQGQRLLFVEVNCWGFENSTRARQYVVEQSVDALAELVDSIGLRNLPEHYTNTLSAGGSVGETIASFFRREQTPQEILRGFAPILEALDLGLVVIIEDTDRNGTDFDPAHIEAMLFDFRSVPRLSFILTVGGSGGLEFPKIAEVLEFLPALPARTALRLLDETRTRLMKAADYIDPMTKVQNSGEFRPDSLRLDAEAAAQMHLFFRPHQSTWSEAATQLLSTPRRLKSLLNALERDWPSLRGEVDLDVWIMVVMLRHAAPSAFTFLGTHLEDLRGISVVGWGNNEDSKKAHQLQVDTMRQAWAKATELLGSDKDAAADILMELIPGGYEIYGNHQTYAPNRLQSIQQRKGPDYWSRIVSGTVAPDDVRDQEVLKLMYLTEQDEALRQLAQRSAHSVAFAERFIFLEDYLVTLRESQRLRLLSYAHDCVLEKLGYEASDDVGGFSVLHSGFLQKLNDDNLLSSWTVDEALRVAPVSLRLANDIMHSYSHRRPWAVNARQRYVPAIQSMILKAPVSDLVRQLDPGYNYSLYHLVYSFGEENQELLLTRPTDWSALAELFMEGMVQHPAVLAPQVVRLFGESVPRHPDVPKDFYFSRTKLNGIFGDRATAVLKVLARMPADFPALDHWEQIRMAFAIKRAADPLYFEDLEKPKAD